VVANTANATTDENVDRLNADFYGTFPYPWAPTAVFRYKEADGALVLLSQDLGVYESRQAPSIRRVWVAGCGANQAVMTALAYPTAEVIGSDVSMQSLRLAGQSAYRLGLTNLRLSHESINGASHSDVDYVISTGVIHHNASPPRTLTSMVGAMRTDGIAELMCYSQYHRIATTAVQRASQLLLDEGASLQDQMALVQMLMGEPGIVGPVYNLLNDLSELPAAAVADAAIQPVEWTYTLSSFMELAAAGGLIPIAPTFDIYDQIQGRMWTCEFYSPRLRQRYEQMSDIERWTLAELLKTTEAPLLWFYFRKGGSAAGNESKVSEAFLNTVFVKNPFRREVIRVDGYGEVTRTDAPDMLAPRDYRDVVNACDGKTPIGQLLRRFGFGLDLAAVLRTRLSLSTTNSAYLAARDLVE
jgi:SAM-dependent methyltransferase